MTHLLTVDGTDSARRRPLLLQLAAPVLEPWPAQHTPQSLHVFDQAAARHQQV
jgi:hypothetical protein